MRRELPARIPGIPTLLVAAIAVGGIAGCERQPHGPASPAAPAGMSGGLAADTVQERDLDLRLEALSEPRPARSASGRNPFRFEQPALDPVPPPFPRGAGTRRELPRPAGGAGGAGGVEPPSPLRFIGVVDAPESAGLIAVLTDGADVFQGRVGDTVDGRYRIARIAADGVELERLLAGGREVLRLDGLR